jgi:predicted RNA-binding protein
MFAVAGALGDAASGVAVDVLGEGVVDAVDAVLPLDAVVCVVGRSQAAVPSARSPSAAMVVASFMISPYI